MKKILKDWNHLKGVHCGSVAIRDICNFYGINLTEEMCFGLGGGLGFYYSVYDDMSPSRSIHVRGPGMESNFFNNFDLDLCDWKYENDNENAFNTIINFLNSDVPVLIQTDIYFLEYYNSNTHFPGHIVVVCGYDDELEQFFISDTGFDELQTVSFESMQKARTSKAKPYPLSNNWMEIDIKEKKLDLEKTVSVSILRNAQMMYDGVETLRGISGVESIKRWADDLINWSNVDDWQWSSRYSYQVISKRGVEGAAFRWFYRDFLIESSEYCEKIIENNLVKQMDQIGKLWFGISLLLKQISELQYPDVNKFTRASHIANEIFNLEKNYYGKVIDSF